MADTTAATGLTVEQWDDKFFTQSVQDNMFRAVMGTSENSIIQVKEDLTKKKGDRLHYALVNRLTNSAVTGSSTLEGNEEAMTSRSHQLTVDQRRNAVRVPAFEDQQSSIPLRNAARSTLMTWAMEDTRDLTIEALGTINGTAYGSAAEAAKDIYLVDNTDRVVFGDGVGSGTDYSADLLLVTSTMTLDSDILDRMRRKALAASPKIRPIRVAGDRRFFVVYAGPRAFRDLRASTTIQNAQRDVSLRMQNIKLFEGGDIEWNGMIVKEIDDIAVDAAAGAAGIDLEPVYLCGAQAIGHGWAKRWESKTEEFDYGDKHGVAMRGWYGVEKLQFGSGAGDTDDLKDHGVCTGWVAAVAD